ncbi:MAG TPA: 3-methyl-2-oxobutanoate hydroxymethyltransferase [Polyangiales bacterium]
MSKHSTAVASRVTVHTLRTMATRGERIVMTTAYDATFARMLDEGGADILLVGDSLGMVVQGLDTTLPVTLDEMIYHARAVSRGSTHAHLIGDMPFMSYQISPEQALQNAGRFLAEGNMHAVKLEGGVEMAATIRRLVSTGIPVMGHVGLKPQSVHAMGGFKVQGKDADEAEAVVQDAKAVADAGAYAVVLEGIPAPLAARITKQLPIPTIGIGAGAGCDGQVLVCYDLLGLAADRLPRFVKRYETFYERGVAAMRTYVSEVREGSFPAAEHSFGASNNPSASNNEPLQAKSSEPVH